MAHYITAAKTMALVVVLTALAGCVQGVNGSVSVPPNTKSGDVGTVNGSVTIGEGATVEGAMTVNGPVHLEARAVAKSLKTVNGEITLADSSKVTEGVFTVNGGLRLANGVDVGHGIGNVNGDISVTSSRIGGSIETVNGDIEVSGTSRVEGGIHVDRGDSDRSKRLPRIVIGPGSTVNGKLVFERPVKLYVSETATVPGPIEGATAEKFSGDRPPAESTTASN
jgi:DUF4097 and DUF4098 domain-containing protein YvlB